MHATEIVGWTGNAEVYCADCKPVCSPCAGTGEVYAFGRAATGDSEASKVDCPDCDGGTGDGVDSEGNPIRPIFAGDEDWQSDYCAGCKEPLDPDGESERKMARIRASIIWVIEARDDEDCPDCLGNDHNSDGNPADPRCTTCVGTGKVDGGATCHVYCANEADARDVESDVSSLCGSSIERDEHFLYAIVDNGDEAGDELRDAGYSTDMSQA